MEISAEKTKLMTNNTSASTQRSKWMDRSLRESQASGAWAVITYEGSKLEILSRKY